LTQKDEIRESEGIGKRVERKVKNDEGG